MTTIVEIFSGTRDLAKSFTNSFLKSLNVRTTNIHAMLIKIMELMRIALVFEIVHKFEANRPSCTLLLAHSDKLQLLNCTVTRKLKKQLETSVDNLLTKPESANARKRHLSIWETARLSTIC